MHCNYITMDKCQKQWGKTSKQPSVEGKDVYDTIYMKFQNSAKINAVHCLYFGRFIQT